MPIYEYACEACDHRFEAWQRMSEAPISECPRCKQPRAQRVISHTSFVLKGGGWYATDYKRTDKPASDKAA